MPRREAPPAASNTDKTTRARFSGGDSFLLQKKVATDRVHVVNKLQ